MEAQKGRNSILDFQAVYRWKYVENKKPHAEVNRAFLDKLEKNLPENLDT